MDRLCRQRHVTESHPPRRLQHTTRSHYQLYQSINDNHKVDITFDARRQHNAILLLLPVWRVQESDERGYTWFYTMPHQKYFYNKISIII